MTIQSTLSIIKPDATMRNLTDKINNLFIEQGLKILLQKKVHLTKKQAEQFYLEHKDRSFYDNLVKYMSSGEVIVQVLSGEDSIMKNRKIMGATNPAEAETGTVRALYGESIDRNSVHGSDSTEAAKREIEFFFDAKEISEATKEN